jgi:hypothetical protein
MPDGDLIGLFGPAEAVPLLQSPLRLSFPQAVKPCPFKILL